MKSKEIIKNLYRILSSTMCLKEQNPLVINAMGSLAK